MTMHGGGWAADGTVMTIQMLKSKIHLACVTEADLEYEGSMGIDAELMAQVGIVPYERILVSNMSTGDRFETYAIREAAGSRRIVLNGATARLGARGDRVIIMSFAGVPEAEVRSHRPRIIRLDERNHVVASEEAAAIRDACAPGR